jgi:epoxyqueuosine reductase
LTSQPVSNITLHVKQEARAAGFDLVGVTTPDPPEHLDVYERWLEDGRHGEMAYLSGERARAARADPHLLLPEVRSILVVGASYPPSPELDPSDGSPRVGAYAQGDDYHDVLKARLEGVVRGVEDHFGQTFPYRIYVDTGPLLERELAQRAGLGWIGKNTCLIDPERGSYMLLAEVLLGLELEPDQPFKADRCGSCTRCIDACPTGCILPDRTIDARACISYLTIELRGAVPEALRPKTGAWVFGCDVCQQVCPWNQRFAPPGSDPAFEGRPFVEQATIDSLLTLDREQYVEGLRRSPLKRAKLHGLKRNACLAAGNQKSPARVQALAVALGDPDPQVRAHAAWALGEIGGARASAALADRWSEESEREVLGAIQKAQAKIARD